MEKKNLWRLSRFLVTKIFRSYFLIGIFLMAICFGNIQCARIFPATYIYADCQGALPLYACNSYDGVHFDCFLTDYEKDYCKTGLGMCVDCKGVWHADAKSYYCYTGNCNFAGGQ